MIRKGLFIVAAVWLSLLLWGNLSPGWSQSLKDYYNQGLEKYNRSDFRGALAVWEQGLKLAREESDKGWTGAFLTNIGNVYSDLGDYPRALSNYEQALKIMREIGVPTGTDEANIGDVYLEQGNYKEALAVFERLKGPIRLGRYYLKTGDYGRAAEKFTRSLQVDEEGRNAEFLVAGYIGLGLAREGLRDFAGAGESYQKGVEFIERQRESLTEPQRRNFFSARVMGFSRMEPYEGLVRVSFYQKAEEESLFRAEHTKARLLLEAVARRSAGEELGLPAELSLQETELINRLAAVSKQMDIALGKNAERYKELEKELASLQKEKETLLARLRKEYPRYAAIRYPEPLRAGQFGLSPGETLIEYEVTEKESFAWLVRGGKVIKALAIPAGRKELTGQVKEYRRFFQGKSTYEELSGYDPRAGQSLYGLLFQSFTPYLREGEPLIIIPDEILGVLPFEALVAEAPDRPENLTGKYGPYPKGVKYLGDIYPISYYQSATALSQVRSLRGVKPGKKMLVVADPVFDPERDDRLSGKRKLTAKRDEYRMNLMRRVEEDGQQSGRSSLFTRLPVTGQLAGRLRRLYGERVEVLEGLEATEEEYSKRPLKQYGAQVFATHGILDDTVPYIREPALVLSQTGVEARRKDRDGFLTLTEVMGLELEAEIVALTACDTGIGKNLTGEGVMGLGRAFQYAGAKGVLMSLWSVEDESTNLLTERFFTHLKAGKGRLEALRLARTDIRRAGYEHPFFWAPFILVGEK